MEMESSQLDNTRARDSRPVIRQSLVNSVRVMVYLRMSRRYFLTYSILIWVHSSQFFQVFDTPSRFIPPPLLPPSPSPPYSPFQTSNRVLNGHLIELSSYIFEVVITLFNLAQVALYTVMWEGGGGGALVIPPTHPPPLWSLS